MPRREYDGFRVVGDIILSESRTLAWKICNFVRLEHKRGEKFQEAGILQCHGYSWTIDLYPRGDGKSCKEDQHVSAYLKLTSGGEVKANYTIRLGGRLANGSNGKVFDSKSNSWGWSNLMKRDVLLASLDDGSLLIEVDIKLRLDKTPPLLPRDTLSIDMLRMLESGSGSDVYFHVGDKIFPAHSCILTIRAPALAEIVEDAAFGADIHLEEVDEVIFSALLRNVYAGEIPTNELMENKARELLDAADRFGSSNLKLLAESKLVEDGVTTETAAELLLFADSKSCALLKETALSYFKANATAVMQSSGWEDVKQSAKLLSEIMETLVAQSSPPKNINDYDNMTVLDLRRQLQNKGLAEDGTREILLKRLKRRET